MLRFEADENSLTTGDERTAIYLKDAYVKWNFAKKTDLYIGLQSTFAYEESEKIWGHRFIEKTIMDYRGVIASRDLGVSIRGKITDNGSLFYNLMFANNSSLKPEKDKYKRMYANFGFRPTDAICITAYCDYSFKEKQAGKVKDEIVSGLFIGLKKEKVAAGIDSYYKITKNAYLVNNNLNDMATFGTSVFGSYKFANKWGAFARIDFWDNNIDADVTGDARDFATAGITWSPINGFTLSPNMEVETYEKTNIRTPKPSIWTRLTFQWCLK